AIPFAPLLAGIPAPTGSHPRRVRCQTSILASEPPTPTTEITWVADPTDRANHGVKPACAAGGVASVRTATPTSIRSRRTPPMVGRAVIDAVNVRARSGSAFTGRDLGLRLSPSMTGR